jgi:V8-like Glu-specific endopeptidase
MADKFPLVVIPRNAHLDVIPIYACVVRLSFHGEGKNGIGTGFFFKIPDSPYEVILTAGHNLYLPTKTFTTQLKVLLPNPNPSSGLPYAITIPAEHVKVSPEYLKDPTILEADYGAILIPYTGKADRRGLGFKMTHAFSKLQGIVTVTAHGDNTIPGRPTVSDGAVLVDRCTENQLVYEAATQQGNSGSPVWLVDDAGDVAVVAIQFVHVLPFTLLHF